MRQEIEKALEVLKNGGVILYPTDTVWGLGCDATNEDAVEKINKIKGRAGDKSFIILLDTDNKLAGYVNDIPDLAYDLIEYAENPLTIIFSDAKNLAKNVVNEDGSVGVRIVKHPFCTALLERFRKPIVSTSANISGAPTPLIFNDITDTIKDAVDLVIDLEQDISSPKTPSTIMKLSPGGQFHFIRR
ncbi:MAG: threonylcarbamoyl-AMP synthase [Sphingobacteriales bacterium]|nr:MAG: threonylcarbamoyl-AMP synthase [Sphingobacteriales bacterium]